MKTKKPHILVACHAWYGDEIGGSFRLASEFAEYLATQGYRVSYVCCGTTTNQIESAEEVVNGVRVFRYRPCDRSLSGFGRLRFHLRETQRLVRSIHSTQPVDIVSGHSPLQALAAMRALQRYPHFSNYTVHSPFDDELMTNNGTSSSGILRRLAGWMARRIDTTNCSLSNRVQCDSNYTLAVMQNRHRNSVGEKGVVAPGWVDATHFVPAASRSGHRAILTDAWHTDVPVFFTLRRLEQRMGLDTLVKACEILARQGLKFRTLIGGGGSLKGTFQQMIDAAGIGDSVQLLGRLPEDQLAACYAAADCFVLPTKALECFGLIVLEAFACNTPVIAANVAAIPELAEQQGTDWMFEPGNVAQIADRMRQFITCELKPAIDLRAAAMEYDKPKILKRWEELLIESPVSSRR